MSFLRLSSGQVENVGANPSVIVDAYSLEVQDIAISLGEDATTIAQDHVITPQDVAISLTADNTTNTLFTIIRKTRSGLINNTDFTETLSKDKWTTINYALTVSSGQGTFATTSTSNFGSARAIDQYHSANESYTYLNLGTKWAISIDTTAGGANNTYSGLIGVGQVSGSGAPNTTGYGLRVAKTAGGTSELVEYATGTATQRATVTKGIDTGSKRIKLWRDGSVLGIVVDGTATSYTDASITTSPYGVFLGGPASSGTSSYTYDNFDVSYGNNIEVRGLTTGQAVRIYDSSNTLLASAVESSGKATLDCKDVAFPITGYIRTFTSNTYATDVVNGRYPATGNATDLRGGDSYYANFSTDASTTNLSVIKTDLHTSYTTTQFSSHGGVSYGDYVYGVYMGYRGEVFAYKYDTVGDTVTTYNFGYTNDQHDTMDLVMDSSGYLHVIYGGTYNNSHTYYTKSTNPYDISAWAATTDLGRLLGSMVIDKNDRLHMFASTFDDGSPSPRKMVYLTKPSGSAWSSRTVLGTPATTGSWYYWACDTVIGRQAAGSQTVHGTWYTYGEPSGTASWKHGFHIMTDDNGATFKKISGSTVTIPFTQDSTTGDISAVDNFQNGNGYTPRLAPDNDGNVFAVIGTAGGTTFNVYKGTSGVGFGSSLTTFTNVKTQGSLVVTGDGDIIYMATTLNAGTHPWDMNQWQSTDGGTTWSATQTLFSSAAIDGDTGTANMQWYWSRITEDTEYNYKLIWHARYSVYGYNDSAALMLHNDGTSTLYMADVSTLVIMATQDITNSLTIDNATITQNHVIAVDDITFSLTSDNDTITQNHIIDTQDVAISLTTDNTSIEEVFVMVTQDIAISLTTDNTTITQNHVFSPDDIIFSLTSDNDTITQDHIVATQDVAVSLTTDNGTIAQNHIIPTQDIAVSLSEDNTSITQDHVITGQDALISLSEDNTTISLNHIIVPQDVTISLTTDDTTLDSNTIISTADTTNSLTVDATTITQNHVFTPDDIAFSLSLDNDTISQNHVIVPQDMSIALLEDIASITQAHIIATQDIQLNLTADNTILPSYVEARNYYFDSDGNIYWVINQDIGLVELI